MGHEAGFAFGQVVVEDVAHVLADAPLHEESGKVRAGDEVGVAHVVQGAFEGAGDACLGELRSHVAGAGLASATGASESFDQGGVLLVHAEAHDVDGFVGPGDGDFDAGKEGQAQREGGGTGAGNAAHFVVVGQRPELHAVVVGMLGQPFRRLGAVGHRGVAVQVGIEAGGEGEGGRRGHHVADHCMQIAMGPGDRGGQGAAVSRRGPRDRRGT